jgi:hypothetical protein
MESKVDRANWVLSTTRLSSTHPQLLRRGSVWTKLGLAALLFLGLGYHFRRGLAKFSAFGQRNFNYVSEPICPQTTALLPNKNRPFAESLDSLLSTQEFREHAITWLSGAVQIP